MLPTPNVTSAPGMAQLQTVLYKRAGLDRLEATFRFREAGTEDSMPKMEGQVVQWYRLNNLAANTTATTEGAPATVSLKPTANIVTAKVSIYDDFISVSTHFKDTAIFKVVEEFSDLLGYRAGLTVDTITRNVLDDHSSSTDLALVSGTGGYLRVQDFRNAKTQMDALNIEGLDSDGQYFAIAHPYNLYDLVSDPAAAGLADIYKYTNPEKAHLDSLGNKMDTIMAGGCRIVKSTNVKKTTGTPNKWRIYVMGKGGFGIVALSGRGPSKVKDPKSSRFNLKVKQYDDVTRDDPTGQIAATIAYYFVYTAVVLDGPTGIGGSFRYRTLDAASSIAA